VLVDISKEMLGAKLDLLEHTTATLAQLQTKYKLMLLTKGDLFEQEQKIARSGLQDCFQYIEIVSQKNRSVYQGLLERFSVRPERFLMIGNSLRSDILPVLELGAYAVYIPHELTWQHEGSVPPTAGEPGYYKLEHLGQLAALLEQLEAPCNL
jgi:putative hydrolase of the HAD superfamily